MKTQFFATLLIAAVGFVAAPAFAAGTASGEVGYVPPAAAASTSQLSRASVQGDLQQAQRSNSVTQVGEAGGVGPVVRTGQSDTSRATVRAQAADAVRHGHVLYGEV